MTDKKIELNRRRVLGGIVAVGATAAAAGAGTFALFSDTETSDGNTVTAGTLDLVLNPNDSGATAINFTNIAPGGSGHIAIELGNAGSVDGTLTNVNIGTVGSDGSLTSSLITDSDGTADEFEDPGPGGELDDNLEVESFVESSGDYGGSAGTTQGSTVTPSGNEATAIASDTLLTDAVGSNAVSGTESLNPPETKYLILNYNLPSGTDNAVQGDTVEFDLQIELEQA